MKTYEYAGVPFTEPRSHPWVDAAGNMATLGRLFKNLALALQTSSARAAHP